MHECVLRFSIGSCLLVHFPIAIEPVPHRRSSRGICTSERGRCVGIAASGYPAKTVLGLYMGGEFYPLWEMRRTGLI